MRINILILTLSLLSALHVSSGISAPQVLVQKKGNITTYTNSQDFISLLNAPLPDLTTDKKALLQELNNLTQDVQNNPHMALAFNILLNSDRLTDREKETWLKQIFLRLPTPFMYLMALFEQDTETAQMLYLGAGARLAIDASMCDDNSVGGGVGILKQRILPRLFQRLGLDVNNADHQKFALFIEDIEKKFFKKGGLKHFDEMYPVAYTPPYWLAHHGMKSMRILMESKRSAQEESELFKPASEYASVKAEVYKDVEGYAAQRGNL